MSKQFIALFREPDGRADTPTEEQLKQHREQWRQWFQKYGASGNITGGSSLTLEGNIILQNGKVKNDIYKNGREIVGGFILLNAKSFE